jgi:hypothetical protein
MTVRKIKLDDGVVGQRVRLANDVVYELVQWTPVGGEGATTVLEALQFARDLLDEEGRWLSGEWFTNHHPEVNPQDPFCNSWGVCAQGAIGVATIGAVRGKTSKWESSFDHWRFDETLACRITTPRNDLYTQTVQALVDHLPTYVIEGDEIDDETGDWVDQECKFDSIPEWNDHDDRTRDDVLAVFDGAIKALTDNNQEATT